MSRYRLLTPAAEELSEIVDYYSSIDPRLALSFLDEFERGIGLICGYPHAWSEFHSPHRRYLRSKGMG